MDVVTMNTSFFFFARPKMKKNKKKIVKVYSFMIQWQAKMVLKNFSIVLTLTWMLNLCKYIILMLRRTISRYQILHYSFVVSVDIFSKFFFLLSIHTKAVVRHLMNSIHAASHYQNSFMSFYTIGDKSKKKNSERRSVVSPKLEVSILGVVL